MKINLQTINFSVQPELTEFVNKKVNGLEKFYDRIIEAYVFLKVESTAGKENKQVEIKLGVPGNDLIVKKTAKSFEEGVSDSIDSLKRQLLKKKEKESKI